MGQKEREALAFTQVLVKHQQAVFTSNPRFAETVSNAFEDLRVFAHKEQAYAALLKQAKDSNMEAPAAAKPTHAYRVAWDAHPELRVSLRVLLL